VDTVTAPVAARRIAVVVNRVDFARQVFEALTHKAGDRAEIILLTGRVRPLDRENILKKLEPLYATQKRPEPEKSIILVATQTIEAGADLDLDALVTEIAPLDSLRQRFGRLDRLGIRKVNSAVILHPAGEPTKGDNDKDNPWTPISWIYGGTAYATKVWLAELGGEIDFGIDGFEEKMASLDKDRLEKLLAPRTHAPVLLPPYIEFWATTSPPPLVTPDPSLFLHGPGTSADVQIVWRADVDPQDAAFSQASLGLCPPASVEALSVPIWAVQRWLRQQSEVAVSDVPQKELEGRNDSRSQGLPALRRDGESWTRVFADDIKSGDTIVAPTSYGGCDAWGWSPLSKAEVADLGTEAHYRQRLKAALRIAPGVLANVLTNELGSDGPAVAAEIWDRICRFISESTDIDGEAICTMLVAEEGLPEKWRRLLVGMAGRNTPVLEFFDLENPPCGFILHARKNLLSGLFDEKVEETGYGPDSITDRADSSYSGTKVTLMDHLQHVEGIACDFARRAGLNDRLVHLVVLAARLHDLGKADPRFQVDLHAAGALVFHDPEFAALLTRSGELLAKSERTGNTGASRFRGLRAVPDDFRHEALSVALAGKHPEVAGLTDDERDLVLWLIGTHHGFGRPFFPPCIDPTPHVEAKVQIAEMTLVAEAADAPLRLDQGWFERVERLRCRYGPWELARLEAIIRLADHAASAKEQENGGNLPT
ncbi:MAG TPA: CRISPR-associated endonuclease Cas3'', partial [Syntrophales bacterium]|nr:CRISPR-associated endonuclease Cas3'' [Syntrophales bacterium]